MAAPLEAAATPGDDEKDETTDYTDEADSPYAGAFTRRRMKTDTNGLRSIEGPHAMGLPEPEHDSRLSFDPGPGFVQQQVFYGCFRI